MEKETIKKMIDNGYFDEANREISKLLKRNERTAYSSYAIKKSMEVVHRDDCTKDYCKMNWNCKAIEWQRYSIKKRKFTSSVIRFATYSIYNSVGREEYNRIYREILMHGFRLLS